MWTSQIIQKELRNGLLYVTVKYSNGNNSFQETYEFTGGDINSLDSRIAAKVDAIGSLEQFSSDVPEGAYVAYSIKPLPAPKVSA